MGGGLVLGGLGVVPSVGRLAGLVLLPGSSTQGRTGKRAWQCGQTRRTLARLRSFSQADVVSHAEQPAARLPARHNTPGQL